MAKFTLSRSSPHPKNSRDCFFSCNNSSDSSALRFQRRPSGQLMKLPAFFEEDRAIVDARLDRLLPPETTFPPLIHRAMRYSVFAGGKRIRPILCLESARIFAPDVTAALHPACAIEIIHTYSMIHEDLPALDNDD